MDSKNADTTSGTTSGTTAGTTADRSTLERELLDEMTSWPSRDQGGALKAWHRHSLSLAHLNVLTVIERLGPMPMRRLAEEMDVSDASATGIVDRMEKRGLVERRHATDARRVVMVYQTDAGRSVFSGMAVQRRETLTKVLAALTEAEMSSLLVGMKALHASRDRLPGAAQSLDPADPNKRPAND